VVEPLYRVELTASFLERLDAIEAFLVEADAGFAFDDLLAELRATVIPNLARFPRIGRPVHRSRCVSTCMATT
jgi:plasmid stabilization system protein ParE